MNGADMKEVDGRSEKGARTKKAIIKATMDLLVDKGPGALTAGNLAKQAKTSKASLFHHFKNMDDVYIAMIEDQLDKSRLAFKPSEFRGLEDFLLELGSQIIEANPISRKRAAAFAEFYVLSGHNKKFRQVHRALHELVSDYLEKTIATLIGRRLVASDRPVIGALIIALEGLAVVHIVADDAKDLANAWTWTVEMISNALKQRT